MCVWMGMPSHRAQGVTESMKNLILWTRSQPSWTPVGRFGQKCSTAVSNTIIKTPNEVSHFARMVSHLSCRDPEACQVNAKAQWSCCGSSWCPDTLLAHLVRLRFPLICHLSVYVISWYLNYVKQNKNTTNIILKCKQWDNGGFNIYCVALNQCQCSVH